MADKIDRCLEDLFLKGANPRSGSAVLKVLNHAITDTQPNGQEMIYFTGKYIGSKIIKVRQRKGKTNNIPILLKGTLEKLGLGNLIGLDLKKDRISLEIEICPFYKKGMKGNCKFLEGMIAGMVSRASERDYKLKSGRRKGRICTFRLEPIK